MKILFQYTLSVLFIFFMLVNSTAQDVCEFPDPLADQALDEETPCPNCSSCADLPENPNWEDMENEVGSNPGGTILFGNQNGEGTSGSEVMNDVDNNPDDFPPNFGGTQAVAFGNMISSNANIGSMVDCMNLNCLADVAGGFDTFGSFSEIMDLINEDPEAFSEAMSAANPNYPADTDWVGELESNQGDVLDSINSQISGLDLDNLAEGFYGINNIPDSEEYCPDNPSLTGGGSGGSNFAENTVFNSPTEEEVDIFNNSIPGLDNIGSDKLLPSPSALNMIDQVNTGVDLYNGLPSVGTSIYNLQSNDLSIPVSLSYNGGGVKVNEYGTEVGNNWTLNAGGQISRVVVGLPDEYDGTAKGSGMGLISSLKPCVNLTGGGIRFFNKHKRVLWSPWSPTQLSWQPRIASGIITIPTPIPFIIPWEVAIRITTEMNVTSKPGRIKYYEQGLGYLFLQDNTRMGQVMDLGQVDIASFNDFSSAIKEKVLRKKLGKKQLDDIKFLSAKVQWALEFWSGITNLVESIGGEAHETRRTKKLDTEPDEFYFNFGSYSGKFVFDQSGEIYTIPHSDLKIEKTLGSVPNSNGEHIVHFKVTTPEGIIYHFGKEDGSTGIDLSEQINYTLPNQFTYPENNAAGTLFDPAKIDETQVQYSANVLCWPRSLLYGSTYERNFTIMNSPKYTSTWQLTKVESILTQEEINLEYEDVSGISYYSQKSLNHTFPNFDLSSGGKFSTTQNTKLNPLGYFTKTEWQNGKGSLVYNVTENKLITKSRLRRINGQRGERLVFNYDAPRVDMINDKLLTRIDLFTNGNFYSKGWELSYEDITPNVNIECSEEESGAAPIYSSPEEFVINLGEKHEKKLYPRFFFFNIWVQVVDKPRPIPIPIPRPQIPKRKKHHSKLSEFGSLVEIKKYDDSDSFDINEEIAKFRAEKGRSFLRDIIQIQRPKLGGNLSLPGLPVSLSLVNFTYNGNFGDIPKRFSMHQDLWGYYNDNSASLSLLPAIKYSPVGNSSTTLSMPSDIDLKGHFSFSNASPYANNIYLGHNESANFDLNKIGSLSEVTFQTGGSTSFIYGQNDWLSEEDCEVFEKGAGLRVESMIESSNDQDDNLVTRTTTYLYETPTIINRPIRISQNPYNNTAYDIESYIVTSTSPFNPWTMNKSNYVGYGKVTETISGAGKIEHFFTTPTYEDIYCNVKYPETFRFREVMQGNFPFPVFNNAIGLSVDELYSTNGQTEPFTMPITKPWRYGLEEKTIIWNGEGQKVQEIDNVFQFNIDGLQTRLPIVDGSGRIYGLKADMYQRNYPGTFWQNFNFGQILSFVPPSELWSDGASDNMLGLTLQIIQTVINFYETLEAFVHPNRYIEKDYFYSTYYHEFEQVRLINSTTKNYFEGVVGSSSTSINTYDPSFNSSIYRLTESSTTFSNGQFGSQKYFYIDKMTIDEAKTDDFTKNALKNIGKAGFGLPLRTEIYENNVLTGGSITVLKKIGSEQIVPYADWVVRDGQLALGGIFSNHHTSGKPEEYKRAAHSNLQNYSGQIYITPINEFVWTDNLQLEKRKVGVFSQDYSYNEYKELKISSDEDGISNTFKYDSRARLREKTSLNGRHKNIYQYEIQPNFVKTTTTFADELMPPQISIQNFNGLAMPTSVIRDNDETLLTQTFYDAYFRPKSIYKIGFGKTTMGYESSVLSRTTFLKDAVGNSSTFTYSGMDGGLSFGKVTTEEYPNNNIISEHTDAFGRIIKTISGEGGETIFKYDPKGRLDKVINPIGEIYEYEYNSIDQVWKKKIPGAGTKYVWWDKWFRPIAEKDAKEQVQFFEYDEYYRVRNIYKGIGLDHNTANEVKVTNTFSDSYIESNKLKVNEYEGGHTWLKKTDDRILTESGTGLGGWKVTTNIGFDNIGRPTQITQNYGGGNEVSTLSSYTDAGVIIGQEVSILGPENLDLAYNFGYDDIIRPTDTRLMIKGEEKLLSRLQYNSMDKVDTKFLGETSTSDQFLQKVDYLYDAAGKLTHINTPAGAECFAGQEFCRLSLDIDQFNSPISPCNKATGAKFGENQYSFPTIIDFTQNSASSLLIEYLVKGLDENGFFGEVSFDAVAGQVIISNTNAGEIFLVVVPCYNLDQPKNILFTVEECCESNGFNPPVNGFASAACQSGRFRKKD